MAKYKIPFSLLCGTGFTSLLLLLLNLSSIAALSTLLSIFLLPGGIFADLAARSEDFGSPLLVLAINSLLYAIVVYGVVSVFGRGVTPRKARLATIWLVFPVVILGSLVCIPKFNPLWPHGMSELKIREQALQESLPVGIGLDDASAVLHSQGIQFQEETEMSQTVVLERRDKSIVATAGDRVISARLTTEATQFPCGYNIEVVLLFGSDQKLKDQYVHRLRLCP